MSLGDDQQRGRSLHPAVLLLTTFLACLLFGFALLSLAPAAGLAHPLTGASVDEQAIARAFPEEIKAANNMDDHGFVEYEARTSFTGDPQELCQRLLAETYRRIHWALPGIGITLDPDLDSGVVRPHLARCSTFPLGLGN